MAVPDKVYANVVINFRDFAGKPSHVSFRVTAAAATAWLADTSTGLIFALASAIDEVSDGRLTSIHVTQNGLTIQPDLPSAVPSAANSSVLLVLNQELTGERDKGRNRIPARKDSVLGAVNGIIDVVSPPTAEISALITAYNAAVLSEENRAVGVVGMRTPGRSEGA